MSLKNMFDNAKTKTKENLPAILTTAAAIGSAAVVYTMTRKISLQIDDVFSKPKKPNFPDFSIHLSGRELNKLKSGIPRTTGIDEGVEIMIATKDMLKDEFLEKISKLIAKD